MLNNNILQQQHNNIIHVNEWNVRWIDCFLNKFWRAPYYFWQKMIICAKTNTLNLHLDHKVKNVTSFYRFIDVKNEYKYWFQGKILVSNWNIMTVLRSRNCGVLFTHILSLQTMTFCNIQVMFVLPCRMPNCEDLKELLIFFNRFFILMTLANREFTYG